MQMHALTLKAGAAAALILALAWQQPLLATADRGKECPSCGSPSWSADGQWIAFDSDHADGKYHVWKIRTDGTSLTRLTPSDQEDTDPAWSPDGQQIAFSRGEEQNVQVWTMLGDGSQAAKLTTYSCINCYPAWSRDNWTLAFVTDRGGGWDILTVTMDGQEGFYLAASAKQELHPSWSPDGSWIAFERGDVPETGLRFNIWKARVGTTQRVQVTTGECMECDPAWNPTQDLIAFDSDRDGSVKLWLVNADGTNLRRVTSQPMPFVETEPAWSPDGTKIAFLGERQYGGEIWIVNADGTGLTQVTHLTEPPRSHRASPG